jgi:hypothetical protein
VEATKHYTMDLIKSDQYPGSLVIGFTEMGVWGAMDDDLDRVFKEGTGAILDAIEECVQVSVKK